ncbi:MAG: hypothetical protein AAGH92_13050 [Planctomycetota bacterium]
MSMISPTVLELLSSPSPESLEAMLDDESAVFWVDWRQEDDTIPEACERVLNTGALSGELVEIDADPDFEVYIAYKRERIKVPLVVGLEDRHITLHTLNKALSPDYEIRFCADSSGSDTLAFIPLATQDWKRLESQYGSEVEKRFRPIQAKPNLFTDQW